VLAISVLATSVVGGLLDGHRDAGDAGAAGSLAAVVAPRATPAVEELVADTGWTCAGAVAAAPEALRTEMSSQRVVTFDDVRLDVDHQGTWVVPVDGTLPVLRCTATGTFATNAVAPVALEVTYADAAYQLQVRVLVDHPGAYARSSRVHPLTDG